MSDNRVTSEHANGDADKLTELGWTEATVISLFQKNESFTDSSEALHKSFNGRLSKSFDSDLPSTSKPSKLLPKMKGVKPRRSLSKSRTKLKAVDLIPLKQPTQLVDRKDATPTKTSIGHHQIPRKSASPWGNIDNTRSSTKRGSTSHIQTKEHCCRPRISSFQDKVPHSPNTPVALPKMSASFSGISMSRALSSFKIKKSPSTFYQVNSPIEGKPNKTTEVILQARKRFTPNINIILAPDI
jgi:hypothetical protein